MTEENSGNHSSKATHEELCEQALKHYERISNEAANWSSVVPKAIKFYKEYGGEKSTDRSRQRTEHQEGSSKQATNKLRDSLKPDAWLFKHRYVYSDREDNRIATASLDSTEEHDIAGNIEPLYSGQTIRQELEDRIMAQEQFAEDSENGSQEEYFHKGKRALLRELAEVFDLE